MKRIIFLGWLVLFLPAMVFAQEKIEAPVWNVGDKWDFGQEGFLEVVGIDKNGYISKFSAGIFFRSAQGTVIFDKSTFNVLYVLEGGKVKKYKGGHRKILNFPLVIGEKWKDGFSKVFKDGWYTADCFESFLVLGWEDLQVRAGNFRTLKLEYKVRESTKDSFIPHSPGVEFKAWYWYSPEVKYLVKGKYEKEYRESSEDTNSWNRASKGGREGWELMSFKVKK
jgi:hypothetical protein